MAKSKRKSGDQKPGAQVKAPEHEAADKLVKGNGKDLVRMGEVTSQRDEKMIQNRMQNLSSEESAGRLSEDMMETGLVQDSADIYDAIAADMGMDKVILANIEFTPELIATIPEEVAKKYRVIPVYADDNEIHLALSDPQNVQALDDLRNILGKMVIGMVANEGDIDKAINKYYEASDYDDLYNELAEEDDPALRRDYTELELTEGASPDEQLPVVRFVDLIFRQAVHERSSDIHIEPYRNGIRIRFRVDGVLHEMPEPPRKWQNLIISRLKVLAGMDLAEKRVPLDGRIRLSLPDKKLDLRVSTLPTIFGESIVMRILDAANVMMGLEDVGFLPASVDTFKHLIKAPNGVILMTGPTGSGKTTTLYAALGMLNVPENKLVTLEDPVEYQIPGINQIQINTEIGLNFAVGLKAVLRQSPDIILVGEIRDLETGENAIRAALTGHLVFSTLHTNDAPSSTVRLIEMGIKPYLVASSMQAAIAQRLVRRVCSVCRTSYKPHPEEIREAGYDPEEYSGVEFFKGEGCERCGTTGYHGRTAIHEIMVMDSELRRRVIRSEAGTRLKRAAVKKGMRTLRMDGWEKAMMGATTLEEVLRVTQSDV
jgi:type IV pilus assembly protein PilB